MAIAVLAETTRLGWGMAGINLCFLSIAIYAAFRTLATFQIPEKRKLRYRYFAIRLLLGLVIAANLMFGVWLPLLGIEGFGLNQAMFMLLLMNASSLGVSVTVINEASTPQTEAQRNPARGEIKAS
ncbi:MAG: hypothetical protein H7A35_09320 [Planctomycetales bacterium]|nr:hypothetical protein [bacterium]UNM07078.1 MAG: hypothetical protein H7A35_09320 [Planctomycetales bacterium]